MFIKSIELLNWKCFRDRKRWEFKKTEIISWQNGTGKTSLFDAICYAVTGKMPAGFNMNTIRNIDTSVAEVYLCMENNGDEVEIFRSFGNGSKSELKVNGKLVAESVRTVDAALAEWFNPKMVALLWTQSLISGDALQVNFFKNVVLAEHLHDPLTIISNLKGEIYRVGRRISSLEQEKFIDGEDIEKRMNEVKSKLKDGSHSQKSVVDQAKAAQQAYLWLQENEQKVIHFLQDDHPVLKNGVKNVKMLQKKLDDNKKRLESELTKENTIYSAFDKEQMNQIAETNLRIKRCICCGGAFGEKQFGQFTEAVRKSGRNNKVVEELQQQIQLAESVSPEQLEIIENVLLNRSVLKKCENFQSILDQLDEENDRLWEEFHSLEKEHAVYLKQQETLKELHSLRERKIERQEMLDFVQKWVNEEMERQTMSLSQLAGGWLHQMNPRYEQIVLSENNWLVIVRNEQTLALDVVPVQQLSGGESTMAALSLALAMHSLYLHELPLLFDETFRALDIENLEAVQQLLGTIDTQKFIITHDLSWSEEVMTDVSRNFS